MSKTFSKESIRRLEPVMTEKIQKLLSRLKGFQETGTPINLLPMFGAFTNDLISEYTYGLGLDWLDAPLFNSSFFDTVYSRPAFLRVIRAKVLTDGRSRVSIDLDLSRSNFLGSCR